MTRYRLPDALGGGEIEAEEMWGGCAGGRPEYLVAGSRITITMPEGTPMEAVAPPLPPEPPVGTVVLVGMVFEQVLRRYEHGWAGPGDERGEYATWAEVCSLGTPVLLVPDPLAGAPELPWTDAGISVSVKVGVEVITRGQVRVVADGDYAYLVPSVARQMGLALLRAAAEVEQATPEPAARPRSCPTCHSAGMPREVPRPGVRPNQLCADTWHDAVAGRAATPEAARPASLYSGNETPDHTNVEPSPN